MMETPVRLMLVYPQAAASTARLFAMTEAPVPPMRAIRKSVAFSQPSHALMAMPAQQTIATLPPAALSQH